MNTSNTSVRSITSRFTLLALGCAFSFAFIQVPVVKAAPLASAERLADKAPPLPLKAKTKKVKTEEGARYVLNLKNTSKASVKVTAMVLLSVAVHNMDKARHEPEHEIAAGETWTISNLAALDKVVVTAAGFAPLEVEIK